jgi:Ni,Fe-hydrogenase I large subunit
MKFIVVSFILFLGISWLFPACTLQSDEKSDEARLNNADAVQAMTIANEWKWSKKEIKSFVTSREVVFKFSKDKVKRIPLPEEKMLVAVAPYIKQTHR